MRPLRSVVFLLAALSFGLGCGDLLSPDGGRSELDANRQKWTSHGYGAYQFTLKMACFCAINGPVTVVVSADSVVLVTQKSNGQVINAPWMPSIKKLFDFIDQGIANHAAVLRVTYDPTLGYPSEIVYDGSFTIADDEVTYTVSDVQQVAFVH